MVGGWRSNPPPPALCSGWLGQARTARLCGYRWAAPRMRTAMRLLIIEDDRDAADYIARAFREVGHVADQAARRRGGPGARARRPIRRADRRPHAAQARRPVGDRRAARQGHRDAGADPVRARPGRRPGQGPARRRRRLSAQALFVLRTAGARRGAGAPPRRPRRGNGLPGRRSRARPAVALGRARQRGNRSCSRANSACSNI